MLVFIVDFIVSIVVAACLLHACSADLYYQTTFSFIFSMDLNVTHLTEKLSFIIEIVEKN